MADVPVQRPAPNQALEAAQQAPSAAPRGPGRAAPPREVIDVWSRTEPRYRRLAIGLLVLNFALFCGLCVFAFWLREARLFDFSLGSYVAPARFWTGASPSLNTYILEPISVLRTPLHAVVLGLLLAAITSVPLLIAILYRFPCVIPFLLAVLIFAHMPWMSLTLTLSAVLASVRPFRMKFRFGAALVGMIPVLLYLWLATRGAPEMLAAASPTQKTLLAAPWVLAILAGVSMTGLVLLIARLVNYRPGAIAPVVGVMFATPIALFHAGVGVDELQYRLLERDFGPRSLRFEPSLDVGPKIHDLAKRVVLDESLYARHLPDFLAALSGQPVSNPRMIWHLLQIDFLADRADAFEACKHFIADHLGSRYRANALFLQARALDTRLDERTLDRRNPRRELYSDFPHVQSGPVWSSLLAEHPSSPLAVEAGFRLAQLALRRGETSECVVLLERVLQLGDRLRLRDQTPRAPSFWDILEREAPESSLAFEPEPFLRDAERLLDLIAANRDDPRFGDEPLHALAALDPHRPRYADELLRLADRIQGARLYDNVLVRWAVAHDSSQRRHELLEQLSASLPDGDGRCEVNLQLANLEVQTTAGDDPVRRGRGVARLERVAADCAAGFWGGQARRMLERLQPASSQRMIRP